jgi:hypothetical protein
MATLMAVTIALTVAALAGAALVGLSARRGFARTPGTFRCRLRVPRPVLRHERPLGWIGYRWSRRTLGLWVHDVLLLRAGLFHQHTAALAVRLPEDTIRHACATDLRRLGPEPQVIGLRLDDGTLVELATTGRTRSLAAGPFLAAAIPGLPPAPIERRRRYR